MPRPRLRDTALEGVAQIRPAPRLTAERLRQTLPRGDGHTVLVLPAWMRGDSYTADIRALLADLGYRPHGWGLGVNAGPTPRLLEGAASLLTTLAAENGPVSLVGYSMGGLFARWLALHQTAHVRQVITVCSPILDPGRNFWLPLNSLLGLWPGGSLHDLALEIARPLPVPATVLFSRIDGLVYGEACIDRSAPPGDVVEVGVRHVLIARNPQVMTIVADRLARPPV